MPYLHLPPGAWQAKIDFEITDNFSKNEIQMDALEFLEGKTISNPTIQLIPPATGRFILTLNFNVNFTNSSIQICVFLMRGAIEGLIKLHNATIIFRNTIS